jgi:tRNA-2-methylthio-N6-dimethylallyladenosine synthase
VPLAQTRREPITAALGRPPRVHLWHIGCQMNDADREQLAEQLAEIGCLPEVPLDDADLAVIISCAVRQNAEQKVYGKFRELMRWKRARPGRAIALTGCMGVEHGSALLDRLPGLDYLFDVREPDGFLARLQALWAGDLDGPLPLPASDRLSAYVPVIGGCNEMCSYCIVPFVRGRELSRPVGAVVDDVRRLVERGVREVTLLGQNVNSYRDPDTGAGLPELMAAVDAVPGLWRQRFLTSHPRNASPALFEAIRDLPTACEQLHLPVQAGDDALLRRMRRVYSVADYRAIVERARATVPTLALSTDVIVGFCGETPAELEGTERLLRDVRFDVVHLQAYSPRPGTAAARRDDDVPLEEKKRRLNHLLALQREIALERNLALRDTEVEILVEGATEDGRPYGRTRANRVTRLPEGSAASGDMVRAVVRSATAWQLVAEPVPAVGGARAS